MAHKWRWNQRRPDRRGVRGRRRRRSAAATASKPAATSAPWPAGRNVRASSPSATSSEGRQSRTVPSATSHTRSACGEGEVEVVGGDDDARPSSARSATAERQLDPAGDVEERRRFVEDEHRRLLGEGPGDEDALALPVRQLGERPRPQRGDAETVGRRRGRRRSSAASSRPRQSVCGCRPSETTSPTVSSPGSMRSVSTTAIWRARSTRSSRRSGVPSSITSPASGGWVPTSVRSSVDLPVPFGPSTAISWPAAACSSAVATDREHAAAVAVAGDEVDGLQRMSEIAGWSRDDLRAPAAGEHPDHDRAHRGSR